MYLKFPTSFNVKYPNKNLKFYNNGQREKIIRPLLEASNNFCMYCGKKLEWDNKFELNIEHSVEKAGYKEIDNIEYLKHCKFNLSVACPACNQSYKTRMIERLQLNDIDINLIEKCNKSSCLKPCEEYERVTKLYLEKNKIILQPRGMKNSKELEYKIKYDILNHVFIPYGENLEQSDINFIRSHIANFSLNIEMFSEEIIRICSELYDSINTFGENMDIQKYYNLIKNRECQNVIGVEFISFLEKAFKTTTLLKQFCMLLIILYYI